MILSLREDLVVFLTFCENAKEESKTLLNRALTEYFRMKKAPPVEVVYLPSGKPAFCSGKAFLSVTHTEGLYAVCFSEKEVGIDCEKTDTEKERVKKKYFDPEEEKLPFSLVWTGKEAVAKITGEGLSAISSIKVRRDQAFYHDKKYRLYEKEIRGYRITVAEKE